MPKEVDSAGGILGVVGRSPAIWQRGPISGVKVSGVLCPRLWYRKCRRNGHKKDRGTGWLLLKIVRPMKMEKDNLSYDDVKPSMTVGLKALTPHRHRT